MRHKTKSDIEHVIEIYRAALANGPQRIERVRSSVVGNFSLKTIWAAEASLGIVRSRDEFGGVIIALPEHASRLPKNAYVEPPFTVEPIPPELMKYADRTNRIPRRKREFWDAFWNLSNGSRRC